MSRYIVNKKLRAEGFIIMELVAGLIVSSVAVILLFTVYSIINRQYTSSLENFLAWNEAGQFMITMEKTILDSRKILSVSPTELTLIKKGGQQETFTYDGNNLLIGNKPIKIGNRKITNASFKKGQRTISFFLAVSNKNDTINLSFTVMRRN